MRLVWELPLTADGISGELDDGSPFRIRPIRASDGPALEAAFARMSPRSRYLRFFTIRQRLGPQLVEQLTRIDHDRHRAWVVSDPSQPSDVGSDEGRGIAVARLILVEDDPVVAEAALAVVDDHQGRGIGRLLLDLLVGTAHDAGIEYLRFEVLHENAGMRALLASLDTTVNDALTDREVIVFDVPVDQPEPGEPGSSTIAAGALYEILRWIAASEG